MLPWIALTAVALAVALAALAWRFQSPVVKPAPAPVQIAVTPPPASMPPLAVVPSSVPVLPVAPRPAAPKPAPLALEETLPSLRELPEPIRQSVPPLVFGGYMYSKNPADRLLLIDKALRHEGEEVAPGLVLEKLLPKAAVMNYRGYRYRVPY